MEYGPRTRRRSRPAARRTPPQLARRRPAVAAVLAARCSVKRLRQLAPEPSSRPPWWPPWWLEPSWLELSWLWSRSSLLLFSERPSSPAPSSPELFSPALFSVSRMGSHRHCRRAGPPDLPCSAPRLDGCPGCPGSSGCSGCPGCYCVLAPARRSRASAKSPGRHPGDQDCRSNNERPQRYPTGVFRVGHGGTGCSRARHRHSEGP